MMFMVPARFANANHQSVVSTVMNVRMKNDLETLDIK